MRPDDDKVVSQSRRAAAALFSRSTPFKTDCFLVWRQLLYYFSVSLRSMTRCVETSMHESRHKHVAMAPWDGAHMPQSGAVPSRSCAKFASFNSGYSVGSVRERYGASPIAAAYPKTEDHQESSGFSSCFVVVQSRM